MSIKMAIKRPKTRRDKILNIVDALTEWSDEKSTIIVEDDKKIIFNLHCGYGDIYTYNIIFRNDIKIDVYGGFEKKLFYLETYDSLKSLIKFLTTI